MQVQYPPPTEAIVFNKPEKYGGKAEGANNDLTTQGNLPQPFPELRAALVHCARATGEEQRLLVSGLVRRLDSQSPESEYLVNHLAQCLGTRWSDPNEISAAHADYVLTSALRDYKAPAWITGILEDESKAANDLRHPQRKFEVAMILGSISTEDRFDDAIRTWERLLKSGDPDEVRAGATTVRSAFHHAVSRDEPGEAEEMIHTFSPLLISAIAEQKSGEAALALQAFATRLPKVYCEVLVEEAAQAATDGQQDKYRYSSAYLCEGCCRMDLKSYLLDGLFETVKKDRIILPLLAIRGPEPLEQIIENMKKIRTAEQLALLQHALPLFGAESVDTLLPLAEGYGPDPKRTAALQFLLFLAAAPFDNRVNLSEEKISQIRERLSGADVEQVLSHAASEEDGNISQLASMLLTVITNGTPFTIQWGGHTRDSDMPGGFSLN